LARSDQPDAASIEPALTRNRAFAAAVGHQDAVVFPNLRLLVITCLDPHVDPAHFLGLDLSDAIVIRNVGERITRRRSTTPPPSPNSTTVRARQSATRVNHRTRSYAPADSAASSGQSSRPLRVEQLRRRPPWRPGALLRGVRPEARMPVVARVVSGSPRFRCVLERALDQLQSVALADLAASRSAMRLYLGLETGVEEHRCAAPKQLDRVAAADAGGHTFRQLQLDLLVDSAEELVLAAEMVVESAARDARALDDLLGADTRVTTLGEQLAGRGEQRRACRLAVLDLRPPEGCRTLGCGTPYRARVNHLCPRLYGRYANGSSTPSARRGSWDSVCARACAGEGAGGSSSLPTSAGIRCAWPRRAWDRATCRWRSSALLQAG
jgi:hypothetical protein